MADVEIKFESEGVDGIVAVGTYLIDAAKRFGIRFDEACDNPNDLHFCPFIVSSGSDILSPLTSTETEHFASHGRRSNERLACEAKIIKSGEITIMTDKKPDPKHEAEKTSEKAKADFHAEFASLPLEKKIASLLKMEAVTLSETFDYVINSPMKVVEKVGDVIAEFGMKIEKEAKKASRPKDEQAAKDDAPKAKPAKPKAAAPEAI